MNTGVSTAALAAHDLGLATSFGGAVFGRVALHPSVDVISNAKERGEVIHKAWRRFNIVNLVSHVLFAGSWFAGRAAFGGRGMFGQRLDPQTKALVTAKDALVVASVVTGVATIATGQWGIREEGTMEVPPMGADGGVMPQSTKRARIGEQVTNVLGLLNLVALAGVVGVTAALAMKTR